MRVSWQKWAKWLAIGVFATLWFGGQPLNAQLPAKLQGVLEALTSPQPLTLEAFAQQRGVQLQNEKVRVVIETQLPAHQLELRLLALEVEIKGHYMSWLDALVPISQLRAISQLPEVHYVRLPLAARPSATISQGVSLIGATEYQSVGYTGAGIKVAVIDLGFNGIADAVANGDLPANVQTFDFTNSGMGGIAHGTAVAEIVHDVAPGAQLLLMKVSNEVNLGHAVEEALRQGVRIINHSVVWFNTEFKDGEGGVSQVASQAANRGVVWVNAAGNTALQHWQGAYRDSDDDRWVEFDSFGSESLELNADTGSTIEVFMNWDAWPQTDVNYDLYLTYDANNNGFADAGEVFVSSIDPQRGLDQPVEHLRLFAPFTGRYLISVQYQGALAPPDFEIFTTQHTLRTPIREGSVLAPATSENVLAVGAVSQASWGMGLVQAFSARGPTTQGRIKPDVVGPDDVANFSTFRFPKEFGGSGRFVGTSAAAPHIAGAIALLFEETPGMSAQQATLNLTRNARSVPPGVPNNQSGYGEVQLKLTPVENLDLNFTNLTLSASVVEAKEPFTVSVQIHNPHRLLVAQTVPLLVDGVTVAAQDVALGPGEIRTIEFSWRFDAGGDHRVTIGNLDSKSIRVVAALSVQSVKLYVSARTQLTLEVVGQGIERATLTVFDLAGQRLGRHEATSLPLIVPFTNEFGAALANGVYLYTLTIEGGTQVQQFPIRKLLVFF